VGIAKKEPDVLNGNLKANIKVSPATYSIKQPLVIIPTIMKDIKTKPTTMVGAPIEFKNFTCTEHNLLSNSSLIRCKEPMCNGFIILICEKCHKKV